MKEHQDIKIREDFRKLIPPLTHAELEQLHKSLDANRRARDPLVIWEGRNVLLDGHNRYDYCVKNGYPFEVVEQRCSNQEEAKNWIMLNQLGRRNLTYKSAALLRGKLYLATRNTRGGDRKSNRKMCGLKTADAIAAQTGVSPRTVEKDAQFAEAVANLGIEDEVMSGRNHRPRSEIIRDGLKEISEKPRPDTTFTRERVISDFIRFLNRYPEEKRQVVKSIIREQIQ